MASRSVFLSILLASLSTSQAGAAGNWEALDPSLLSRTEPKLDPEADAEYLLRRVRIEDKVLGGGEQIVLMLNHFVRLKIYTERGKEEHSVVDLLAADGGRISGLKARTILPDGRVVEVEKGEVFERDVTRASGVVRRQQSFALPALEVGAVVEYQWTTANDDTWSHNLALELQAEAPTWRAEFEIKPIDFAAANFSRNLTMRTRCFQCDHLGWKRTSVGWYGTSFDDIAAFREEPHMPPWERLASWMLVYYDDVVQEEPERFWKRYGKEFFDDHERATKADAAVAGRVRELLIGATTPQERVMRLVTFCNTHIKNLDHPLAGTSTADLGKRKPAEKASETLARGLGTGAEVQQLLVAMATAAGFEARLVKVGSRASYPFEQEFQHDVFLSRVSVAIKVDGVWQFYDGTDPFLEPGMLSWPEEGSVALIADPKNPEFVRTPVSGPERSQRLRTGRFTLADDGSLSGAVEIVETGFLGLDRKWSLVRKTATERVEAIEKELLAAFPTATVEGITVENAEAVDQPVAIRFDVTVPKYAERTGSRLFLKPSIFGQSRALVFTNTEREHPVAFDFPWSETDEIEIHLPTGFALDGAEAPGVLPFEPVGQFELSLHAGRTEQGTVLRARRALVFGRGGRLAFPKEAYPSLKQIFEAIYQSDQHVVALKGTEPGGQP